MTTREDLQAVQEPLKQRYRDEPGEALITLSASGVLGEGVTCARSPPDERSPRRAFIRKAGGDGLSLCSHMLLGFVACAASRCGRWQRRSMYRYAGRAVACEGDLDLRGHCRWS